MYEVRERRRKTTRVKKEKQEKEKGVGGVATKREPQTFLYRARSCAWACRCETRNRGKVGTESNYSHKFRNY